jgi:hypothetical protein
MHEARPRVVADAAAAKCESGVLYPPRAVLGAEVHGLPEVQASLGTLPGSRAQQGIVAGER